MKLYIWTVWSRRLHFYFWFFFFFNPKDKSDNSIEKSPVISRLRWNYSKAYLLSSLFWSKKRWFIIELITLSVWRTVYTVHCVSWALLKNEPSINQHQSDWMRIVGDLTIERGRKKVNWTHRQHVNTFNCIQNLNFKKLKHMPPAINLVNDKTFQTLKELTRKKIAIAIRKLKFDLIFSAIPSNVSFRSFSVWMSDDRLKCN